MIDKLPEKQTLYCLKIILERRKGLKITHKEAGKLIGISRRTYINKERDGTFSFNEMIRLLKLFDLRILVVPVEYLEER